MQPPSRHVHIRRRFGQVKPSQLPFEPSRMVWLDACLAASFKKSLQPLMPERLNHTMKLYSVAFRMSTPYVANLGYHKYLPRKCNASQR